MSTSAKLHRIPIKVSFLSTNLNNPYLFTVLVAKELHDIRAILDLAMDHFFRRHRTVLDDPRVDRILDLSNLLFG